MAITFFPFGRVYGIDSIIELLSMLVALLITYQSYKVYKIIGKKEFRSISIAFALIAISFLFKIFSNLTIFYYVDLSDSHTTLRVISQFKYMQLFNFISLIFYRAFLLLGFLILFFITTKITEPSKIFMYIYLGLLVVALSIYVPFIYYLTLVFVLIFLTTHFYQNYRENQNLNSMLVFLAFLFILLSKLVFIFSTSPLIYLSGEFFLLLGFVTLLINQLKIKNEQKKKPSRSNKRYSRLASNK